jgi:hypothetical protein
MTTTAVFFFTEPFNLSGNFDLLKCHPVAIIIGPDLDCICRLPIVNADAQLVTNTSENQFVILFI